MVLPSDENGWCTQCFRTWGMIWLKPRFPKSEEHPGGMLISSSQVFGHALGTCPKSYMGLPLWLMVDSYDAVTTWCSLLKQRSWNNVGRQTQFLNVFEHFGHPPQDVKLSRQIWFLTSVRFGIPEVTSPSLRPSSFHTLPRVPHGPILDQFRWNVDRFLVVFWSICCWLVGL